MIYLCSSFIAGVYVGTYYKCKPTLDFVISKVKEMCPDRNDYDSEYENVNDNDKNDDE